MGPKSRCLAESEKLSGPVAIQGASDLFQHLSASWQPALARWKGRCSSSRLGAGCFPALPYLHPRTSCQADRGCGLCRLTCLQCAGARSCAQAAGPSQHGGVVCRQAPAARQQAVRPHGQEREDQGCGAPGAFRTWRPATRAGDHSPVGQSCSLLLTCISDAAWCGSKCVVPFSMSVCKHTQQCSAEEHDSHCRAQHHELMLDSCRLTEALA